MGLEKEKQVVVRRPRGTKARKKAEGRGTAKMKAAANKTLEEHSDQIAKSLLEETLKGNSASARILLGLAEGQNDDENKKPKRSSGSGAAKLASEPAWGRDAPKAEEITG